MAIKIYYNTVNQEKMGGGCLAPKPNLGELATQLIDQLHDNNTKNTKQDKYMESSTSYSAQKQKIFKKAPLRKLVDYLSSHRHKLVDSLTHNLKVCIEKGKYASWTTGLIILERFILLGSSNTAISKSTPKIENILKSRGQNSSYNQSQILKGELPTLKTQTDKQNKSGYYSIQSNSAQSIVSQILGPKFQSVLLDTFIACIDQTLLYNEILRILCEYLQIKPKCFANDEKAIVLINALMQNLKTQYQIEKTLQAYYRSLSKLKDKLVLSMCSQLKFIIKLWIETKQLSTKSKNIIQINSNENKINWLQLIFGRFLASSLNGMQYTNMIKLIMQIQDQYLFDISLQFQSLYIYILGQSQLGIHFLKGLFLQFLRYAIMGNYNSNLLLQITQNSRQLLSCNSQNIYKNIKNNNCRQKLYQLLKRWLIIKKYISLYQIISYHSPLFIYCFSPNIYNHTCKNICQEIIQQTNQQLKYILIQSALEIYQRKETSSYIRNMVYHFYKPLNDSLKSIHFKFNISRFVICTQNLIPIQIDQIYTSLMELYSKFDKQTISLYIQQICELLGSMVTFLHQDDEIDKNKFCLKLLLFIQYIVQSDIIILANAFYNQIQKIIIKKQLKQNKIIIINNLLKQIKNIFQKYHIENINNIIQQQDQNQTNSNYQNNNNKLGQFSCYFKEIVANQTKSKLSNTNYFQKTDSVLKGTSQINQEESIKDILEMINY